MFGYVIPDKPNMLIKDFSQFKAYYCGLCKSIGAEYGQLPRFATNFDSTFLLAFIHNVLGIEPEYELKGCVLNPLKKKQSVKHNDLSKKVADVTMLLGYYKAEDDVLDEGGIKKRSAKNMLRMAKKKAAKRQPEINGIIQESYKKLRSLEAVNCNNIDEVSDCFSGMLKDIVANLAGEKATKEINAISYNLGRWIYLADAVDDLEKDAENGCYNPIIASLGAFTNKQKYLTDNAEELSFLLNTAYNAIVDNYNLIEVKISEGVLSNIIYLGLKRQTEAILKGAEKCKITHL